MMLLGVTAADTAVVLGAIGILLTSMTATAVALLGQRRIDKGMTAVHEELVTFNNMTPGEQIDSATIARLEDIPHDERTVAEQDHLNAAPPREPPQGPSGVVERLERVEQVGNDTHDRVEAINQAVNAPPGEQPSLYELLQGLDIKVDAMHKRTELRFQRLEQSIGLPDVAPDESDTTSG